MQTIIKNKAVKYDEIKTTNAHTKITPAQVKIINEEGGYLLGYIRSYYLKGLLVREKYRKYTIGN